MATSTEMRREARLAAERREAERQQRLREATRLYNFTYNAAAAGESVATNTPLTPAPQASGITQATADDPILVTSMTRAPQLIVVVGAGGNGARVVPPLMQMLREGDHVAIIDHDIVEDRNLFRQHFAPRDIGQPKASVLASRYNKPDRIPITAYNTRLTPTSGQSILAEATRRLRQRNTQPSVVFLGCVDNAAARQAIYGTMTWYNNNVAGPCAWIDVGNELRGGQVILSFHNWQMKVMNGGRVADRPFTMNGMEAMPQLLRAPEGSAEQAAPCGERIDLQTVQVNHMASCAALNVLSWLMLGLPFTTAGTFFSTLNSMQPIKLREVNWNSLRITPEPTYANGPSLSAARLPE